MLTWNVQYFLGIPEMDAEHCRIIEMIHRLDQAADRANSLASAWKIVNELTDYIGTHFTHEESLMERSGYPDLDRHREAHRQFEAEVREISSHASVDSAEIRQLLQHWLEVHIMKIDRAYVSHVQAWQDSHDADGGGA
ncbi:bacteriohemerythrin [Telmatospirillum sp.]|uniref:bacteriohemerythrin n=1 Tax=Telmatospirillum sp. TaxID=2079197 RepID=UPI0028485877|nr:bacteriohemerythrin [Telmatospirillum sp.]MDR3437784.1 bacteriohemerythrin [Telmatospirillum sp.]